MFNRYRCRFGPITLKDILEIHRRVLGYVDPFGSGAFRRTQVYVGDHVPPAPNDIPPLMKDFEQWLNSESAVRLHPIQYAALAHYKLVHIHPFDDGNGRTSRLLMNTILMQAGFPPVIIFKQDRHRYSIMHNARLILKPPLEKWDIVNNIYFYRL